MRAIDAEQVEQADNIASERRGRDLAVDIRGAAVSLHLDADYLVPLGQRRDECGEVEIDSQHAAVQQDKQRPGAIDLVVHVQAVDICVPGVTRLHSLCPPESMAQHSMVAWCAKGTSGCREGGVRHPDITAELPAGISRKRTGRYCRSSQGLSWPECSSAARAALPCAPQERSRTRSRSCRSGFGTGPGWRTAPCRRGAVDQCKVRAE
jgi:hypothetical protein